MIESSQELQPLEIVLDLNARTARVNGVIGSIKQVELTMLLLFARHPEGCITLQEIQKEFKWKSENTRENATQIIRSLFNNILDTQGYFTDVLTTNNGYLLQVPLHITIVSKLEIPNQKDN